MVIVVAAVAVVVCYHTLPTEDRLLWLGRGLECSYVIDIIVGFSELLVSAL